MPLTKEQKKALKELFENFIVNHKKLIGAYNEWEKPELGKNRDWKRIAEMIDNPVLDQTKRMKPLQNETCVVCEIMKHDCFIWKPDGGHDCPELLFDGFCFADPKNDFNDFAHTGDFKRASMHRKCLKRLAHILAENVDSEVSEGVSHYCKHYCKKYKECSKQKSAYDRYVLCENLLEENTLGTIRDAEEIVRMCS